MRFGFAIPSYGPGADGGAVAELLAAGEELGFESAWFPDHIAVPDYAEGHLPAPFLEPLATCGWALGRTHRLRIGTDVLVAPYRHPLTVAAMAGTLSRLGGDRLILGVGIGYLRGEFDVLGVPYANRAAATEAWIGAARTPPPGYSMVTGPSPTPIWVGGNSRDAVRRAALLGDGWHPLWLPPATYRRARETILEVRREHNISGEFTFSFSAGTTAFAAVPPNGWPAPAPRPPAGSEFRYAPAPWCAPDGRPGLVGSPDDLVADLRSLAEAGVEHITLRFAGNDPAPLERFAREVAPAFSSAL